MAGVKSPSSPRERGKRYQEDLSLGPESCGLIIVAFKGTYRDCAESLPGAVVSFSTGVRYQ